MQAEILPPPLRGMRSVRIKKDAVLQKLVENRNGHRAIFEEALEGFHRTVIQRLEEALGNARAGKIYNPNINLPQPIDHTPQYNRVIQMLEMSEDEELELSNLEFYNFVLDDWDWVADFLNNATTYGSVGAKAADAARSQKIS